ncbi:MAG: response regulator [bacterium]
MNKTPNKILVVDDDQNIVNLVQRILDLEGYESIGVLSANEALSILSSNYQDIDIIICDYMMPEMDGLNFVKMIKQEPRYENIKIIMLTAIDAFDVIKQSMDLGVKDYIVKPFDPQEVLNAIEKLKHEELKKGQRG